MKKFLIELDFEFAAAHKVRNTEGPCARLHGHNWKLRVTLKGSALTQEGYLLDFFDVKETVQKLIIDRCDHQYLNEIEPFDVINPTCEHIANWIFDTLDAHYTNSPAQITAVSLFENNTCKVTVTNE
jgi:6-pyruvoyltetrahydropterin/6-carboxytetrahydropterin synthase